MAKKKIERTGKKVNTGKAGKLWSELKPGTQRKYKAAGVTPQKFNAWRNPKTRANAAKKGLKRWQFLGLESPTKISGLSKESARARARENMRATFGDRPKYNDNGVAKYLDGAALERLKAITYATQGELFDWAMTGDGEDFDDDFKGLYYH